MTRRISSAACCVVSPITFASKKATVTIPLRLTTTVCFSWVKPLVRRISRTSPDPILYRGILSTVTKVSFSNAGSGRGELCGRWGEDEAWMALAVASGDAGGIVGAQPEKRRSCVKISHGAANRLIVGSPRRVNLGR